MTIKKLLEMEIHEEYMFNHRTVLHYDKTVQAEKTSSQWEDSTKTKRRIS